MTAENNVYLSIGSNLGDCEENLKRAIKFIDERFGPLRVSSFYKSSPLCYEDQNWFLNASVHLKTDISPLDLIDIFQKMERSMGQFEKDVRFGPRIIDIDIVFYEDLVINTEKLVLPHERMHERAFVLLPLMELDSGLVHPVLNKSIAELMEGKDIKNQECIKI